MIKHLLVIQMMVTKNDFFQRKSKVTLNQNLLLHNTKQSLKIFKNRKYFQFYYFLNSTWGTEVLDMQLISKYDNGIRFFLFVC